MSLTRQQRAQLRRLGARAATREYLDYPAYGRDDVYISSLRFGAVRRSEFEQALIEEWRRMDRQHARLRLIAGTTALVGGLTALILALLPYLATMADGPVACAKTSAVASAYEFRLVPPSQPCS